ncbi:MAG: DUF1223 domain-containing protein [Alphaproteobacteria bacterium]
MKIFTTALTVFGLFAGSAMAEGTPVGTQPRSVVELFTSQGCSSCPPADKLMGEFADREDILALSFNVDVWDWIGWKDTLASPANTERQRAYATAMGERSIYTPQVIVDGRTHMVGSDRDRIEQTLRQAEPLSVPIHLVATEDSVTVSIGGAEQADMPNGVLWLVLYDRSVTVMIERGENTGRTLTYNNVVRKVRPVAMWKGKAMTIDVPKSEIMHAAADGCAFLLQVEREDGAPGPMLGAARIAASW